MTGEPPPPKRADARRNADALVDAAAAAFVESGVGVPVREIATRAGVGVGTIYRHFPTRTDLIVAVYRHQVEALAEAGPRLLDESPSPREALVRWVDQFVDFLVTKHGLAEAMRSDDAAFDGLHSWFLDRLVPACDHIRQAAVAAGDVRGDVGAIEVMRGVGNLCIGAGTDSRYDARRMVGVLLDGLRVG
ncbi:MAG: TetR/AcrR family transcriptional regulator [Gordonia paraffinivorans]